MIHASIIPNRQVIHILPTKPDLKIMVLNDELDEPIEEPLALGLGEPVDALHVVADGEHALPPRYGVRADHRVDGLEDLASVLGRAARRRVDLEVVPLGGFVEGGLRVVRC